MVLWTWLVDQIDAFRLAITGFFGALVSGWFQRDDIKSKRDLAIFVVSGSVTAHFLTGLVGDYFDVSPANAGGIGFLLGAFGGVIIKAAIGTIKRADFWAFVVNKWGK